MLVVCEEEILPSRKVPKGDSYDRDALGIKPEEDLRSLRERA
jgi:hypothetical protein